MEMPVWQKAHHLALEVFNITVPLPRSEDYGLTSQIRRSSNSVPANLAEGFGRNTRKDKANFYIIARGSVFETQSHLIYGQKIGYFSPETTQHLIEEYSNLCHEINKILKSLSSPQPQP
jgi:four helix bundle protein